MEIVWSFTKLGNMPPTHLFEWCMYIVQGQLQYLFDSKDTVNKTIVHIVFNLKYIYVNSDKVTDKKSGKVCFGVEFIRKNHDFSGQYICLLQ